MYMVIEVDPVLYGEGGDDELAFIRGLIAEESVYCMPGAALYLPGWFRLVLTYPPAVTREACERIAHYCQRRLMTTATNSIISLKLLSGEEEDRRRSLPMMEEVKRSTKTTMINGEELGDDGLLSAEDRDFESGPRSRFAAEEEIPKVFFSRERGG
jgi:hypothetical protein